MRETIVCLSFGDEGFWGLKHHLPTEPLLPFLPPLVLPFHRSADLGYNVESRNLLNIIAELGLKAFAQTIPTTADDLLQQLCGASERFMCPRMTLVRFWASTVGRTHPLQPNSSLQSQDWDFN